MVTPAYSLCDHELENRETGMVVRSKGAWGLPEPPHLLQDIPQCPTHVEHEHFCQNCDKQGMWYPNASVGVLSLHIPELGLWNGAAHIWCWDWSLISCGVSAHPIRGLGLGCCPPGQHCKAWGKQNIFI